MSAGEVRRAAIVVCVAGVAGMIVSSIASSTGAALTFGLITAVAVLCSIVATAVTQTASATSDADELGVAVEDDVALLVDQGADETRVRELVTHAVQLGRALR
jgi:hypothetical protein